MRQKILCCRSPLTLCFLHRIFESTAFCIAISGHPVVQKDQSDVVLISPPETIFQPRTGAAGVHTVGSGVLDTLGIVEQVSKRNRIMPPFPIHTHHPEESCSGLGRVIKHSASGNRNGDLPAIRFLQDGRHRSFQAVL